MKPAILFVFLWQIYRVNRLLLSGVGGGKGYLHIYGGLGNVGFGL
jgi:hypothetical protein